MAIPLSKPDITENDIAAVANVLRTGMLVQGEQVAAFESDVAAYLGIKNVVAVSNGTASLHLALIALGVGPGDEVIVPAFSYVATANVVELVGAKCTFVDIDEDTFNINVEQTAAAISPRTKAIIPVHEFGLCCNITGIAAVGSAHGVPIIEDAACALGATEKGAFAGTFGQIGSFSLHPRKAVTSGEGGFLITDDDDLANEFRTLRNHGNRRRDGKADFARAGLNYRMTEFQAALVRGQFARLEEIIARRQILAAHYLEYLRDVSPINLPVEPSDKRHTWQTFHCVVDHTIDRDNLISDLANEGVFVGYGAQCIPVQTYYREKYALDHETLFPNATRAYRSGLALPMYASMSHDDAVTVSSALRRQVGAATKTVP